MNLMGRIGKTSENPWPKDANWWVNETWFSAQEKHERYLKEAEVARLLEARGWRVALATSLRWLADHLEPRRVVTGPSPHRAE